jgi:hypothetical protein
MNLIAYVIFVLFHILFEILVDSLFLVFLLAFPSSSSSLCCRLIKSGRLAPFPPPSWQPNWRWTTLASSCALPQSRILLKLNNDW